MKVIKVVFDNRSRFILDIVKYFSDRAIIDLINLDNRKTYKKAKSLQTNFGTKLLPLLIFEDENLEEVAALWSENNPDWEKDISKKLDELYSNN